MPIEINFTEKRHSFISFGALLTGIILFFIVFVSPTQIAHVGNSIGDAITIFLTTVGIVLSLAGLLIDTEKKLIPSISLILCSSFLISWIIMVITLLAN